VSTVPTDPKIYHITHWQNLAQIITAGVLWSDAKRIELGLACEIVGMSTIKRRRLEELAVKCHPGTKVGEYVPFYFCPRSIMLYILHMGNHPELSYRGGQGPMVHLVADLHATVEWARANGRRWAFSDTNAGTRYANFYARLENLDKINWSAVAATDFRDMVVKEGKQAEFMIHEFFPWHLVEKIGVQNDQVLSRVTDALRGPSHTPTVAIERAYYY
jgi:hypothetical protein